MNQRYGAWAQLLVLFRLFHDGAEADGLQLPRRLGVLFDPDRFPFLEGRRAGGARQGHERVEPPLIPDGTVYRGPRQAAGAGRRAHFLPRRDVEQIGSVYETMMAFRLAVATGRSVAIKAQKKARDQGAEEGARPPRCLDCIAGLRRPDPGPGLGDVPPGVDAARGHPGQAVGDRAARRRRAAAAARAAGRLATRRLRERGEREARDLEETLRRQRERIVEELDRHQGQYAQITLDFDDDERRQLQTNMRYWRTRLDQFDRDLKQEPGRIRAFYEVQATRVEPVGLVYLWPDTN